MTDIREKLADAIEAGMGNVHDMDTTFGQYAEAAADAIIDALPSLVKPMKWRESDTGDWICDTVFGRYQIQRGAARWCCMCAMGVRHRPSGDEGPTWHRTEVAAKAAAQSDYTRRILAALGVEQ